MTEPLYLGGASPLDRIYDITWKAWVVIAPIILLLPTAYLFGEGPKPLAIAAAGSVDWQTNPQSALQLVLADNQRLLRAVEELIAAKQTDYLGWLVGAAGIGIAALKMFNGPAGVLAEGLWAAIAPKFVKDAEKKRDVMADGFIKVAEIMRSFPPNTPIGVLIDKLDRRLPEDVKKAYREWEAHEADDRPAAVPSASLVTGT